MTIIGRINVLTRYYIILGASDLYNSLTLHLLDLYESSEKLYQPFSKCSYMTFGSR